MRCAGGAEKQSIGAFWVRGRARKATTGSFPRDWNVRSSTVHIGDEDLANSRECHHRHDVEIDWNRRGDLNPFYYSTSKEEPSILMAPKSGDPGCWTINCWWAKTRRTNNQQPERRCAAISATTKMDDIGCRSMTCTDRYLKELRSPAFVCRPCWIRPIQQQQAFQSCGSCLFPYIYSTLSGITFGPLYFHHFIPLFII